MKTGKVLVTGASGFIGSAVVRQLLNRNVDVRCLVRTTSRRDRLEGLPIEFATGDIRSVQQVLEASSGCDRVIHVAGPSRWSDLGSPEVGPMILVGIENVLNAARATGVKRVVHVSSAAVLGPTNHEEPRDERSSESAICPRKMRYAAAKREAEKICRRYVGNGIEIVIVNPCEVFGPGDRDLVTAGNLLPLLRGRIRIVCRGGTSVAHVDDIGDSIVRALDRGRSGERYFLGGDNISHRELAIIAGMIIGQRSPVVTVPNFVVRGASWIARRIGARFAIPQAAVPFVTAYWFLDAKKARSELGATFRPALKTLEETIRWLRETGQAS